METIEEHSKLETSDSLSPPPQKELRLCLVGGVANDTNVVEAAKSLKIPIDTAENCPESPNDSKCLTFYVVGDFDGPTFDEIQRRSKQCILGPPALKQIVNMSYGLIPNARPLYNYSMRGVVTCFTGIRKKDELTRLVTLIHAMGGCIRKDMNSKTTHLISNHSSGEKYRYAKTFRLTVLRPEWVYAAWERRDDVDFAATSDCFSQEYKLKPFEGQKICFFGFPSDEHQHMVDVLITNGGVATELDDPECSHVVMPNVGFLPQTRRLSKSKAHIVNHAIEALSNDVNVDADVVVDIDPVALAVGNGQVENAAMDLKSSDSNKSNEACTAVISVNEKNNCLEKVEAETKSTNKVQNSDSEDIDGIVLETEEDEKRFQLDISYISPILAGADGDADGGQMPMSVADTTTMSEKKSKFLRTGSIARKIRYSMTVMADNAPFFKGRKQRRNSLYNETIGCESAIDESLISCVSLAVTDYPGDLDTSTAVKGIPLDNEKLNANLKDVPKPKISEEQGKQNVDTSIMKTPILRILRPRRCLSKSANQANGNGFKSASLKRDKYGAQTQLNRDIETLEEETCEGQKFLLGEKTRKRKFSEKGETSKNNESCYETPMETAVQCEDTPKSRILRPRRCIAKSQNATISVLPCSLSKTSFFGSATKKRTRRFLGDTLNASIRSTINDDDEFDFDDMDNTVDSCQISMMSQSSKIHKSLAITDSAGGSVKRTIRRSIHYVSEKTPLSKILRSRRSSITSIDSKDFHVLDSAVSIERPNKRARMEYSSNANVPEFKTPKVPPKLAQATMIADNSTPTAIATITTTKNTTTSNVISYVTSSSAIAQDTMQMPQNLTDSRVSQIPSLDTATTASLLCTQKVISNFDTVVDEHSTQVKPTPANINTHILKSDWFWYTIQNGYADETDYLFGDYLDSIANTPDADRRESLPISLNKRKRKRFSQRLQFEGSPLGIGKRRSSISDAVYSSFSDSFLDCTASPDSSKLYSGEPESGQESQATTKKSLRFMHFMDFISTESNYVGILDTIVKLFKIPLEEMYENGDALLNNTEIKSIFGNFLSIHEVHQRMLENLREIQNKWTEDCLIGDIILELKDELIKSYPPYINFFESMKEMLAYCDNQNPRFHAFLKINQTKPECGRQSLQDLMIRPVQRLPSISLLLNDILKHTAKSNPDYVQLEEALKAIKEVMTYINEDKRKTESRVAIFDIFNDIEGCPAHLVSSNRSFISKCEVLELSDELSGRGDSLMFYLFSDTIEVCKKRSRGFNTAKSPGSTKMFKHVKLLPLNAIRFVIDITDSPRAFALLCRQDKDKLYSFTIVDEEVDKIMYIKTLCKQMAQHACRADAEKSLLNRTSQELDIDISNVNLSTLAKLAARTRLKVGRAFSFNKTPSKLKRAVSTMMTSPFGSTNTLTPSSQLAQMRLASCTNIHEAIDEDGISRNGSPTIIIDPPLSVQPERKNKSSTLHSLGRL